MPKKKSKQAEDPFREIRKRAVEIYQQGQAADNKPVGEAKTPKGGGRGGNPIDPPAGAIPAPEGETPLWELSPEELRARVTAQLWPGETVADTSAHRWVPKPAVSLADYLKDGI